jgi:hypothetical protein
MESTSGNDSFIITIERENKINDKIQFNPIQELHCLQFKSFRSVTGINSVAFGLSSVCSNYAIISTSNSQGGTTNIIN